MAIINNTDLLHRNTALYVVTCRNDGNDVRARAVVESGKSFGRCRFVHPTRSKHCENPHAVRPWRNPLKLLQILGLDKLSRALGRWLFFPSADMLFIHTAYPRLISAIRGDLSEGLQVSVLLTAPPHACVTLVSKIKQTVPSVRVVVDWQDLWSYDESYFLRAPQLYRKRVLKLEQLAMESADLNITTNERARALLMSRHMLPAEKVAAIPHHFLASQRHRPRLSAPGGTHCRVGFLGNLFKPPKVRGDKVFRLFDQLAEKKSVSLEVIGDGTGRALEEAEKLTRPCVHCHERLPLDQAISKLASMDLLLLTLEDLPNCKIIMHGKLPAYLAAGVPIVALVPEDSFVADLVRATGTGFVLSDPSRWETELGALIDRVLSGAMGCCPNLQEVESYDWKNLQTRWHEALATQTTTGAHCGR